MKLHSQCLSSAITRYFTDWLHHIIFYHSGTKDMFSSGTVKVRTETHRYPPSLQYFQRSDVLSKLHGTCNVLSSFKYCVPLLHLLEAKSPLLPAYRWTSHCALVKGTKAGDSHELKPWQGSFNPTSQPWAGSVRYTIHLLFSKKKKYFIYTNQYFVCGGGGGRAAGDCNQVKGQQLFT